MITCYPILRQLMIESGTTFVELASVGNMSMFELQLKMLGIRRWKLTEVVRICCFFNTQESEHLFQKRVCFVRSEIL